MLRPRTWKPFLGNLTLSKYIDLDHLWVSRPAGLKAASEQLASRNYSIIALPLQYENTYFEHQRNSTALAGFKVTLLIKSWSNGWRHGHNYMSQTIICINIISYVQDLSHGCMALKPWNEHACSTARVPLPTWIMQDDSMMVGTHRNRSRCLLIRSCASSTYTYTYICTVIHLMRRCRSTWHMGHCGNAWSSKHPTSTWSERACSAARVPLNTWIRQTVISNVTFRLASGREAKTGKRPYHRQRNCVLLPHNLTLRRRPHSIPSNDWRGMKVGTHGYRDGCLLVRSCARACGDSAQEYMYFTMYTTRCQDCGRLT